MQWAFRASCQDILAAARAIAKHIAELDYAGFRASGLHQDAVIRQLLVLGEAAGRIDKDLRLQYPEVNWAKMIGLRNWLVHGYDRLSLQTIWHTASSYAPRVALQFEAILTRLDDGSQGSSVEQH